MPPKKRIFKEKPSMKTVKEAFRVSDLLRVEVCDPIKKQIDKIKVCTPHLKEPVKLRWRPPICFPNDCYPICQTICIPNCSPSIVEFPDYRPSRLPHEILEVFYELRTIKAEIEELKKAIK